ncbi:MAG: histidine kinase N-terminal 7TM domain-containing protein [Anaerolineae bacterium]
MSFSIYTIFLLAGSITSCLLIYFAWRNRRLANPLPFTIVMLAAAEWSGAYILIIQSASMEAKILGIKAAYIGAAIIPVAWLIFILQYTHRTQYITRRKLLLLTIVPVITILLAWTNERHQFVWHSALLDSKTQFLALTFSFWNWVFVVYSYALIFVGTILLIRTLSNLLLPDIGQIVTLLLGAFIPWAGNIMYISGLNPLKPLDPTPFTFVLVGIAMYWGFQRFRKLRVQPLVQSTLFDNLPDGVLVLNNQDAIVMLNPAAQQLLGRSGVGRPLTDAFPAAAQCLAEYRNSTTAQTVFSTGDGPEKRHYDWRMSTLYDNAGQVNGRIITLRDITKEQQAKEHLQSLHQKNKVQTEILRRRENYWQILNDITQAAVSAVNLPGLLQIVADKMGELIHADACHITLWDETNQRTIPGAASGVYKKQYKSVKILPGETTMTQSVLNMGHALPIENAFNTPYISRRLANLFPNVKSALGLPFIAANEKLGAALLLFHQPHHFAPDEINRAEHAATQIALAIAKIKSNDAMKQQLDELAVLNDIAVAGAKAKNVNDLIEQATEIVRAKFYPNNFGIYLVDEKANLLRSHYSYHRQIHLDPQPEFTFDQGIVGRVATTGAPLRIGDVSQYSEYCSIVPDMRSELCVPLQADDELIGIINTESEEYDAFTEQDERLLVTLAGQLATAIKKVQLLAAEQVRRKEAETLREATAVLTSTLDLNHLLNLILLQLNEVLTYDSATIFMFQKNYAQIVAARGLPDNKDAIGQHFATGSELFAEILRTKQPIYLADAQEHPAFQGWAETSYVHGWMGVPLIVRDVVIGYLTIDSQQIGRYGPNETEFALAFANQAAIAIENARLYAGEQEQRQIAETLRAANAALTQNLDFHAVLEMLLDFLHQLVPYDSAAVMRLTSDKQIMLEAHRGYEQRKDFVSL